MLYFLVRTEEFIKYAVKNMSGTSGRQRVSSNVVGQYKIPIMPKGFILEYAEVFRSIMSVIRQNSFESRNLAITRDTLLPKLMSGEIDVSKIKL
jgi:type I restriction enzyme S subunit